MRMAGIDPNACQGFSVTATGNKGSRATFKRARTVSRPGLSDGADEVPARRVADPAALVQRPRRHAEPARAGAPSGHRRAGRPGRPRAAVPDGADHAGGQRGAEIAIPEEVLDIYRLWRPTPLYRARRLEQAVGTRSRIFYKYEGVSPAGSHKPNTAVAQAFYNKREGRTRLSTETGAGQWGSALAFACKLIGLECKVYMVRVSYDQKPFRRSMIQTWGAEIVASPSQDTQSRPRDPRGASRHARQPRHRDLGGGRGRGRARGHGVLARQRAEPRAAAPDGDRPGGDRADGARRRVPGRRRSAASAAARTSPGSRSRSSARRSPAARSTSSRASRPRARRSRAASSRTTSATRAS